MEYRKCRGMLAGILVLAFAGTLDAEPARHWYRDPKVWTVALAQAGTAAWQIKASHDCRARAGIGQCFGGYGERKAMVGFVVGVNAGAFALSMWARHADLPEWSLPALGAASFNVIDAARNSSASCKTFVIAGQCQDDSAKDSGMRYRIQ